MGQLLGLEYRWNSHEGIYFAIKKYGKSGEHVFAADPKTMHTDELWIEWSKLVADFLAGKGEPVRAIDINNIIQSHFLATQVDDNGIPNETTTVGGLDAGRASERDLFIAADNPDTHRPAPWQYSTAPADAVSGGESVGVQPAPPDGDRD